MQKFERKYDRYGGFRPDINTCLYSFIYLNRIEKLCRLYIALFFHLKNIHKKRLLHLQQNCLHDLCNNIIIIDITICIVSEFKGLGTRLSSWRAFLVVCAIPALLTIFGLFFLPESPRYLLEVSIKLQLSVSLV